MYSINIVTNLLRKPPPSYKQFLPRFLIRRAYKMYEENNDADLNSKVHFYRLACIKRNSVRCVELIIF